MPTAMAILSKIFDKDGVEYTTFDNNKIKTESDVCEIYISKPYKARGYEIGTNCEIKNK